MKRIVVLLVCILWFISMNSQIFGTSSTLKKGAWNLGFEPSLYANGGSNSFALFLQSGVGLTSGVDLGVKLGLTEGEKYIGADVEFALSKRFSFSGGVHQFYNLGLDATALFTLPLTSSARLTSGLDMDVVFADSDTFIPMWIPLSVEINVKRNMVFILETEMDTKLIDRSYNFIGGGIQFYL